MRGAKVVPRVLLPSRGRCSSVGLNPKPQFSSWMLTLRAIFLSLFMAENCLRRVMTALSRGLSGATPAVATHGWPAKTGTRMTHPLHSNPPPPPPPPPSSLRTWYAVARFLGSEVSIFRIKSLALSEIWGHGSDSKSISPPSTDSKMPCSVSGQVAAGGGRGGLVRGAVG